MTFAHVRLVWWTLWFSVGLLRVIPSLCGTTDRNSLKLYCLAFLLVAAVGTVRSLRDCWKED